MCLIRYVARQVKNAVSDILNVQLVSAWKSRLLTITFTKNNTSMFLSLSLETLRNSSLGKPFMIKNAHD